MSTTHKEETKKSWRKGILLLAGVTIFFYSSLSYYSGISFAEKLFYEYGGDMKLVNVCNERMKLNLLAKTAFDNSFMDPNTISTSCDAMSKK